MPIKGGLFVLILVALAIRSSTPIKRGCSPTGYKEYEPFMSFTEAEDTGLLGFYLLYSPPRPKKLSRVEMLLRTRSLIMILLLIGCVESHPGEFYKYYFYYSSHTVQVKTQKNISLQFIPDRSKNIIAYYLTSKILLKLSP